MSLKRIKGPSPDHWTVNFFSVFYDLIELDLVAVVNESRTIGKFIGAINSTFIALILKGENIKFLNDF